MSLIIKSLSTICRGTVEDTELVDGLVLNQRTAGGAGLSRVEKAKIGLIQFCISPPKTDVSTAIIWQHALYIYQALWIVTSFFGHKACIVMLPMKMVRA